MRPLGAAVIGSYGDTRGRRAALMLSIGIMGVDMFAIAALPTAATVGLLAPVLLVTVRLVQGFSLGGQFGGALTLLAESAPGERRGWFVNLAVLSGSFGMLLSSGVVLFGNVIFSNQQMLDFGWRIPFGLGGLLGVVAMIALLRTPETESFAAEAGSEGRETPVRELFRSEPRALTLSSLLNGYQSLCFYVIVTFVPTYLVSFHGAPPEEGILAGVAAALVFGLISPVAGGISDRIGRKPVLYLTAVGMALLAVPLFLGLAQATPLAVIPSQLLLMLLVTLFSGALVVAMTELFSTRTRYTGVSVSFSVGATVFGGTAPLLATALIKLLGTDQAPAFLLVAASILILPVLALTPETAPVRGGAK